MIKSHSITYGGARAFVHAPDYVRFISRLVRSCSETYGVINAG